LNDDNHNNNNNNNFTNSSGNSNKELEASNSDSQQYRKPSSSLVSNSATAFIAEGIRTSIKMLLGGWWGTNNVDAFIEGRKNTIGPDHSKIGTWRESWKGFFGGYYITVSLNYEIFLF